MYIALGSELSLDIKLSYALCVLYLENIILLRAVWDFLVKNISYFLNYNRFDKTIFVKLRAGNMLFKKS